jgi:hypothetical protein
VTKTTQTRAHPADRLGSGSFVSPQGEEPRRLEGQNRPEIAHFLGYGAGVTPSIHDADAREERLAKNEVLFRSVNERIEQQAIRFGGLDAYEFICECATRECIDRVALTLREYEHVRAEGTRFVVVPGHANVEVELVVEQAPGYHVVEKDGAAGVLAELTDPRDGDELVHQ